MSVVSRNDSCPCGSGKKYKKCCLERDEALARQTRQTVSPEGGEDHFISEIRPKVNEAVDKILARLEKQQLAGVEADIEALFRDNPDYHMTNFAMGVYRAAILQEPESAIPFFEKAVRIFPLLPEAHINLGLCYLKSVRISDAVNSFRKAIRYAGDDQFIIDRAQTEIRKLEQLLTKDSPFQTLDAYLENQRQFDLAFEKLTAKRYDEAVQLFGQVLAQFPNHVQSHGNIALAYAGLGKKAVALEHLEKALALDPTYGPAIQNREILRLMQEGEPLRPAQIAETRYYRDRLNAEKAARDPK